MDPLDAIDPLVQKPPAAPDPSEPTPEQREAALAEVRARTEAAQAQEKLVTDSANALVSAAEVFQRAPTAETKAAVEAALRTAQELGVQVDTDQLQALGAIDPPAAVDLDAAPEPEPDPEPPPVVVAIPDADPLVLVPNMVPVYNPAPFAVDLPWNGSVWVAKANGVSLCGVDAVDLAIGLENPAGPAAKMGLRRLYGPEPRFAETAEKQGQALEEWCRRRNAGIVLMADKIWESRKALYMKDEPTSEDFGFKQ